MHSHSNIYMWSMYVQCNPISVIPMHLAIFNVFIFTIVLQDRLDRITERNLYAFSRSHRERLLQSWCTDWMAHTCLFFFILAAILYIIGDLGTFSFCAFKILIDVSVCRESSHFTGTCYLITVHKKISINFYFMFKSFAISFQTIWDIRKKKKKEN